MLGSSPDAMESGVLEETLQTSTGISSYSLKLEILWRQRIFTTAKI
jgi:hypothetical protein